MVPNMNLAPTDSRFRPDQRALEEGNFKLAASEKHRLEEKQRAARKARGSVEWIPRYFTQSPDQGNEIIYKMSRNYWQDKLNKNWQ